MKTQCTQKCEPEKEGAAGEEKAGNNGNWVNEVAGEEGIGGSGDCFSSRCCFFNRVFLESLN